MGKKGEKGEDKDCGDDCPAKADKKQAVAEKPVDQTADGEQGKKPHGKKGEKGEDKDCGDDCPAKADKKGKKPEQGKKGGKGDKKQAVAEKPVDQTADANEHGKKPRE